MTETKLPPQSIEAEQATLGAMLIERQAIERAITSLTPEQFYSRQHQMLFREMVSMYERGSAVDMVTLTAQLKAGKKLQEAGGEVYLSTLVERVSTAAHVGHYAEIVRRTALDRQIEQEMHSLRQEPSAETAAKITTLIAQRDSGRARDIVSPAEILPQYFAELCAGKQDIIRVGYRAIDELYGGRPGEILAIAARAGVGKTAFLANIVQNLVGQHLRVAVAPTEMSPTAFLERMMPLRCSIPARCFRFQDVPPDKRQEAEGAIASLMREPMFLFDCSQPSLADLRRLVIENRPQVLVVDYVGHCKFSAGHSRAYEVEDFMMGLKDIARVYGVFVITAIQMARRTDFMEDDDEPKLSDLADSSGIEKESSAVCMLWRQRKKRTEKQGGTELLNGVLNKNRGGAITRFELVYNRVSLRISDGGAPDVAKVPELF